MLEQSLCTKSRILSYGFISKCLHQICLLSPFKFKMIPNFLFVLSCLNMLRMYSTSECCRCSLTHLSESFFILFEMAFLQGKRDAFMEVYFEFALNRFLGFLKIFIFSSAMGGWGVGDGGVTMSKLGQHAKNLCPQ